MDNLIADGIGFKKDKDEDGSNRGQIKVIIDYNNYGSVYSYSAWTRATLQDLAKKLLFNNLTLEEQSKLYAI
jgi:hypothetical protein